jgi:cytochrome c oxidase cbb3-type subunit 4
MDITDLRIAVTLISLVLFLAIVVSTWRRSRQGEFEEAARLPFAQEDAREERA